MFVVHYAFYLAFDWAVIARKDFERVELLNAKAFCRHAAACGRLRGVSDETFDVVGEPAMAAAGGLRTPQHALQGGFDPNKTRRTRPGEVNIKPNE